MTEQYLAPDLSNIADPFPHLAPDLMVGMFGPVMKTYIDKMKAARGKLAGFPLRYETHLVTTVSGKVSDTKSVTEVTRLQKTTASPSIFEVPADYTPISLPAMIRTKTDTVRVKLN